MYEREFSNWISENKLSYNILTLFAFLVDFKIIRFIYSRFADYNYFNAKFKDYSKKIDITELDIDSIKNNLYFSQVFT